MRAVAPRLPGTRSGFASRAPTTALRARDAPERLRPDGEFGRDGGRRTPRLGFAARPGRARWSAPAHRVPPQGVWAPRASGVAMSWSWLGLRLGGGGAACPGKLRPVLRHQPFSNLPSAVTPPPTPALPSRPPRGNLLASRKLHNSRGQEGPLPHPAGLTDECLGSCGGHLSVSSFSFVSILPPDPLLRLQIKG